MAAGNAEQRTIDLVTAIESKIQKVQAQSLDLSFNELLDMHKTGELDINPDYQRLFQWSEGSRSRFIESLLLEMPVPPIYVIEETDGHYLLIDGLQRLSSYLHLRGELEALHLDPAVKRGDKLVLFDCDIVDELNGRTFDTLGPTLQIKLKRAFVRVEVIRKGSDPRFRYHMFKRLNTGGQLLSEQQVRNCTIRLLDPRFNDFIIRLSKSDEFKSATEALTQQHRLEAFDQELVLRFFAFKNRRNEFRHDVSDFLTEYMELVADPNNTYEFDYPQEEAIFRSTFDALGQALGEQAFAYANKARERLTRGFSVYHYEAITIGIQPYLSRINPEDEHQLARLKKELERIKLHKDFMRITTGGGKNSPGPLKDRIDFVTKNLAGMFT